MHFMETERLMVKCIFGDIMISTYYKLSPLVGTGFYYVVCY